MSVVVPRNRLNDAVYRSPAATGGSTRDVATMAMFAYLDDTMLTRLCEAKEEMTCDEHGLLKFRKDVEEDRRCHISAFEEFAPTCKLPSLADFTGQRKGPDSLLDTRLRYAAAGWTEAALKPESGSVPETAEDWLRLACGAQTLAGAAVVASVLAGDGALQPDSGTAVALGMLSDSEFDALLSPVLKLCVADGGSVRSELEHRVRELCGRTGGRPAADMGAANGRALQWLLACLASALDKRRIRITENAQRLLQELDAELAAGSSAQAKRRFDTAVRYRAFLQSTRAVSWKEFTGAIGYSDRTLLRDMVARVVFYLLEDARVMPDEAGLRTMLESGEVSAIQQFFDPWLENVPSQCHRTQLSAAATVTVLYYICELGRAEEFIKGWNHLAKLANTMKNLTVAKPMNGNPDVLPATASCWRRVVSKLLCCSAASSYSHEPRAPAATRCEQ